MLRGAIVFGGHGRLGTEICRVLEDQNIPYCAPTRDESLHAHVVPSVDFHVSCIINCIACHTKESLDDEDNAYLVNAGIAQRLAHYCSRQQIKFVQISTDYVFGDREEGYDGFPTPKWSESDPISPVGTYGKTKAAGELLALGDHWDTLVVRTASLFGSSSPRPDFVKFILGKVKEGREVDIVTDVYMTPSYTPEVALHVVRATRMDLRGVVHLSNNDSHSWYTFARMIAGMENTHLIKPVLWKDSGDLIPRPGDSSLKCSPLFRQSFQPLPFAVRSYHKRLLETTES